jgi:ribonuclease HI
MEGRNRAHDCTHDATPHQTAMPPLPREEPQDRAHAQAVAHAQATAHGANNPQENTTCEWRTYTDGSWEPPEDDQASALAGAGLVTFRVDTAEDAQNEGLVPTRFPLHQVTTRPPIKKEEASIHYVKSWHVEDNEYMPNWNGARKSTNNTAEISALIKAIENAYTRGPGTGREEICSDSLYAINMTTGKWMPKACKNSESTNEELISTARHAWRTLMRARPNEVQLTHVRSHTNIPGNEVADWLAERGRRPEATTVLQAECWLNTWLARNGSREDT